MKINLDAGMDSEVKSIREIACEVDYLSQPDGSAYFHQGDTSVLAAVYGPGEVKMNKEIIDKATVDVHYKPKIGLPGCEDKYLERIIRNTCETIILTSLHPRTLITIIIQEMQNSGSYLACCINSACLALLDAGIPMEYTTAAVACIFDNEGALVIDPTKKQEANAKATFTFAFSSKDNNVVSSATTGQFDAEQYQACLSACRDASRHVFDFYKETMRKKLNKSLKC